MEEQKNNSTSTHTQNHPNQSRKQPSSTSLANDEGYLRLRQRNRQRLIGAGALTLLIGGLLAIAISGSKETQSNTQQEIVPENISTMNESTATASETNPTPIESNAILTTIEKDDQHLPIETANTSIQDSHSHITAEQQAKIYQQVLEERNKTEEERLQREQMIAERAKQAQLEADQNRQNERNRAKNEATTTENKKNTPTKSTSNNTRGNYVVQAGAFTNRTQADQVRAKLLLLGFQATILDSKTAKGSPLYRVQAIGFKDRNQAQEAATRISANGLDSLVMSSKAN